MYQVVTEEAHFFHHNTALRQGGLMAFCVNNNIAVINTVIIQCGNHASHGSLPFTAVHDADDFGNGNSCQHSHAGLPA